MSVNRAATPYDRFLALSSIRATGHERPVGVTFQFLLEGRKVIELSDRYSASKLMTSLQPGHNRPVSVGIQFQL